MKAFAPIILAVCGLLAGTLSARILSERELRSAAENLTNSPETAQMLGGARTLRSLETITFPNGDLRVAHLSPSGHVLFTPSGEQVRISEYDFVFPEADSPGYLLLNSVAEAGIDRSEGPAVTASLLSTATYEYVEPIRLTAWNQRGTLAWLSPRNAPGGCTAIAYAQIMRALEWPVRLEEPVTDVLPYTKEYYTGPSLLDDTYTIYPYTKIRYDRMTKSPYYVNDKGYETLESTKLIMLVDIFSEMSFSEEGLSGAFIHDAADNPWYEPYVYLHNNNGANFESFLNAFYQAAQEEIPICAEVYSTQGNHAIMITGWQGSTLEAAQAYFNFGWGESAYQRDDGWYSLRLLKSTSAYNYIIHAYLSRPLKTVQVAPLRKVTTAQPTLEWALAKCYADDVSGFTVKMTSDGTTTTHQVAADARTWTSPVALTEGRSYSFTVTPVFTDSAVTPIESNTVSTTIRADADMAPREVTFASGSSVSHPDMNFKDGAFRSVTFNGTSVIHVTAPPSTVELTIHSMRPDSYPESAITIHKVGEGKYDLVVDGTKPTDRYEDTRVLYTVCAKDEYGTITAGEMILHYNSFFPSEPYAGTPTPEPEPVYYTVQVTQIGNGTVTGGGTYADGTTVTLRAIPDADYTFTGWSGYRTSSNAVLSFTLTEDVNLTATFTKIETPDPEPEPEPDPEDPVNPDSGYTGTFYAVGATQGDAYDLDKPLAGDGNLCWAYAFACMVDWYQDMYLSIGATLGAKEPQGGENILAALKKLTSNVSGSFQRAIDLYINTEGYMLSYIDVTAWRPNTLTAYKPYFYSSEPTELGTLEGFSQLLLENLYKGPAFVDLLKVGGSGGHAVVIWGAEFEEGIVKSVYISDSDDGMYQYTKYPVTLSNGRINFYESWAPTVNAVTFLYAPAGVEVTPPQNEPEPDDTIEMPDGTTEAVRTAAIAAVRSKHPGKPFTKIKNPGVPSVIPNAGVELDYAGVATFTYEFGISSLTVTADGVVATATLGDGLRFADGVTLSLIDMNGKVINAEQEQNGNDYTFTFPMPTELRTFIFKARATK